MGQIQGLKSTLDGVAKPTDNIITNILINYISKDLTKLETTINALESKLTNEIKDLKDVSDDRVDKLTDAQISTRTIIKDTLTALDTAMKEITEKASEMETDKTNIQDSVEGFREVLNDTLDRIDKFTEEVTTAIQAANGSLDPKELFNAQLAPVEKLLSGLGDEISKIQRQGKSFEKTLKDLKESKEITKEIAKKLKTLNKDEISKGFIDLLESKAELNHKHKIADVRGLQEALNSGGGTSLPDQTGNAGKYLKTDGSALSWDTPSGSGAVDSVNGQTGVVVLDMDDINDVVITDLQTNDSIVWDGSNYINFRLTTDEVTEGTNLYFTDQGAIDAVGAIVGNTDSINLSFSGSAITADANVFGSIVTDGSGIHLDNDSATPGNSKYYGTDGAGAKGFYDLPSGGGGISWSEVTGTSQAGAINTGYIANNAGLVTITLPTTAAVGSVLRVAGKGAGGWQIAQNASEIIHFGTLDTTTGTGGSLESTNTYDSVELLCIVADTEWLVISSVGNITVT